MSILNLHGTGCYGDSSVLSYVRSLHVDYCSSTHDACPAGRTPVASPDTYVGNNACACCSGTQKLLDSETGACVDPGAGSLRSRVVLSAASFHLRKVRVCDTAPAVPTAPASCATLMEFMAIAQTLTTTCCTAGVECPPGGIPSRCTVECEEVLLPMQVRPISFAFVTCHAQLFFMSATYSKL